MSSRRSHPDKETADMGAGDDAADEGLGVEGLTIVVHLKGRDDLVINTDLRDVL